MTDPLTDPTNWAPAMPLFEDVPTLEECGCAINEGHRCRPPWADEEGWPE